MIKHPSWFNTRPWILFLWDKLKVRIPNKNVNCCFQIEHHFSSHSLLVGFQCQSKIQLLFQILKNKNKSVYNMKIILTEPMFLTIQPRALDLRRARWIERKTNSFIYTFPAKSTSCVNFSRILAFFAIMFLPLSVLNCIYEWPKKIWLTMSEFACLSLFVKPVQQVAMDI